MLNKVCVLGALLPATSDPEKDVAVFEQLMAMDAEGFGRRIALSKSTKLKPSQVALALLDQGASPHTLTEAFVAVDGESLVAAALAGKLRWAKDVDWEQKAALYSRSIALRPFEEWLDFAERAECVNQAKLFAPIWAEVNAHLGTEAYSFPDLVGQLGIARFGARPVIGDAFSGSGQIPFEAARLGCDVVASDLNPIACMLTWGALNYIGADQQSRQELEVALASGLEALKAEVDQLGFDRGAAGAQIKSLVYCTEVRCPRTGYLVPLANTWVVSKDWRVVAKLKPDHENKRFTIDIVEDASDEEMGHASVGTLQGGDLVYDLDGETIRLPIKTLRGDRSLEDGAYDNALRKWTQSDVTAKDGDVFQDRLFAILWNDKNGGRARDSWFTSVGPDDEQREAKLTAFVQKNARAWQEAGWLPDMPIEHGEETARLVRERGWTHWHHLFTPRQLAFFALARKHLNFPLGSIALCRLLDRSSRLNRWSNSNGSSGQPTNVFSNNALNTLFSFGSYASLDYLRLASLEADHFPIATTNTLLPVAARECSSDANIWITDPPYADAVRYEEVLEYFIAWLRTDPPGPFKDWVWDSRRALAIKGTGESFKTEMIAAYKNLSAHMPDSGRQIVMFTHQDAEVWADMAAIMWGAGLQVTAAWYVATETTSELKKGGYVQGTVLLILRKRLEDQAGYRDEITQEITAEVALQIETLTGLNDRALAHGRSENLFEDADLQMAGYAAALRVLTGYSRIDGEDMAAYAARPRVKGRADPVKEIIDFAADAANSHLVPREFPRTTWATLTPDERFYLKMVDLEAVGLKKLDNYQNFAKAFRADWEPLMASREPNSARLKTSAEFGKTQFGDGFGETSARRILWAMHQLQEEDANGKALLEELRTTPRYYDRREDLKAIALYLGAKRADPEGEAARTLAELIENERLG